VYGPGSETNQRMFQDALARIIVQSSVCTCTTGYLLRTYLNMHGDAQTMNIPSSGEGKNYPSDAPYMYSVVWLRYVGRAGGRRFVAVCRPIACGRLSQHQSFPSWRGAQRVSGQVVATASYNTK